MIKLIENSQSYYNCALKYLNDKQVLNAYEMLLKSINFYSKDVDALNLLGLTCYMLCDFDKAKYYWAKSKSINEDNNRAIYYLNIMESEKFELLICEYNNAIDLIDKSNYKEAITKLDLIIDMDDDLIEPYAIIGLCYLALDDYNMAKSYIKKALSKDRNNIRYLYYLDEINELIFSDKPNFNHKILFSASALLTIILLVLFINEQSKYRQAVNRYMVYEQKYNNLNIALSNKENELKDLEDKLMFEKNKYKDINLKVNSPKDKYFSENENDLFKKAYNNLKNGKYEEAIEQFSFITSRGIEEYIVAESLYLLSVSYERIEDYVNADKYYEEYIRRFPGRNYYDDSLYNYGLLLYKSGNIEKAQEILFKLKEEMPESIFVNSKVEFILND